MAEKTPVELRFELSKNIKNLIIQGYYDVVKEEARKAAEVIKDDYRDCADRPGNVAECYRKAAIDKGFDSKMRAVWKRGR